MALDTDNMIQYKKLPYTCPFALNLKGKISEIITHIIDPKENEKKAINPKIYIMVPKPANSLKLPKKNVFDNMIKKKNIPIEPIIKSILRPITSIRNIDASVNSKCVNIMDEYSKTPELSCMPAMLNTKGA